MKLSVTHGSPNHIRSGNELEFIAGVIRNWLKSIDVKTLAIEPSNPWENGYTDDFNGKLCDELLKRNIFCNLKVTRIVIDKWPQHYNAAWVRANHNCNS